MDLLDGMHLFMDGNLFVIICQGDWPEDPMRLGVGDSPLAAYEDLHQTTSLGDDPEGLIEEALAAGKLKNPQPAYFSLEACHGIDFFEDPENAHPIVGQTCLRSFVPDYDGAKREYLHLCVVCARAFDDIVARKELKGAL